MDNEIDAAAISRAMLHLHNYLSFSVNAKFPELPLRQCQTSDNKVLYPTALCRKELVVSVMTKIC